jgi:Polyketide cyclase / dehydrase and lipid transport
MLKSAVLWTALVTAVSAVVALPASAHGPTRQKVTSVIVIDAPADKVWSVIGNFHDMSWHPAFKETQGEGGNAVGADRTLVLESGDTIKEKLTGYNADAKLYKYEITEVDVKVVPVTNYSSSIQVSEADGKSSVQWKGAFYRGYVNNDPPPELSDEAAVKAITGVYQSGLAALKMKIEGGE